jgi:hypothetical protein
VRVGALSVFGALARGWIAPGTGVSTRGMPAR